MVYFYHEPGFVKKRLVAHRLHPDFIEKLKKGARDHNTSMTGLIEMAVDDFLRKDKAK